MMLRPRWVAMLVLALAIAAGFALLGQWQLDRAIESGQVVERSTEMVLPLAEVAQPDGPPSDVGDRPDGDGRRLLRARRRAAHQPTG